MPDKIQKKLKGVKKWNKRFAYTVIMIALIILTGALFCIAANIGISAAQDAYRQSFEEQRAKTREKYYRMSYVMAEKKYHVRNNVTIEIQDITEESLLEVLQVGDVEYIYDTNDTRVWTAVFGTGVYTVDLEKGEFTVDQERQYVLVRVPRPQFDRAHIKYESTTYEFKDGLFNGSISEGVNDARNDLKEAQNKLNEKMRSSQFYLNSAEESAIKVITSLVKGLNPDFPDLVVEVEFMD